MRAPGGEGEARADGGGRGIEQNLFWLVWGGGRQEELLVLRELFAW